MKFFSKIVQRIFAINSINYKEASKLLLPLVVAFAIGSVFLAQYSMPGHNFLYYLIFGLSFTAGLALYAAGLLLSIFAFKKAHDLFRQDDGLRESVAA
jgi:hypothetical protein